MAARNTRITLQRPAAGEDAAGQPVTGFATVGLVWADDLGQSGREVLQADAKASQVRVSFRIRKRSDVAEGWRVLSGADVFEVKAVLPERRSRMWVDLVCESLP